jgi:ABC-type lipoprotein release transport system permease subunit
MRPRTLVARGLRFHWRSHVGVVLGAAVATAVLVGALVVGDSVRFSLRRTALARIGRAEVALASADVFFRDDLAARMAGRGDKQASAPVLVVRGVASRQDATARVNEAQILGVDARFWRMSPGDGADLPPVLPLPDDSAAVAAVSARTARALGVRSGDAIVLRVARPTALPLDAPLSGEDAVTALRVTVRAVVGDDAFGRFSLAADQVPPHNVFLPLEFLQEQLGRVTQGRANLLLLGAAPAAPATQEAPSPLDAARARLREVWTPTDAQLDVVPLPQDAGAEVRTSRIFLDRAVTASPAMRAPGSVGVLTYLVNELRAGERAAPYSMVAAVGTLGEKPAGAPLPLVAAAAPEGMADDEILINQWLADDLAAKPGDEITLTYFVPRPAGGLETRTSRFRVRGVLPMDSPACDRTLMPDFPGIADEADCRDWKPGIDIDLDRIRPKDEAYWDTYRGTPKAFVTLTAGQRMWANRWGDLTAVRLPGRSPQDVAAALRGAVEPEALGLVLAPVRERALAASGQAMDFGQLFLGLSFFLIAAALILTGLLFAFGAQQRAEETGTLLALGFPPRRVRRLMLAEGAVLTLLGAAAGTVLGLAYTRAVLAGLATVWQGAVGASDIVYHARPLTLVVGAGAGVVVALAAIWVTLRRQARAPARELLAAGAEAELNPAHGARSGRGRMVGVLALAGIFAGGGAAMLVPGLKARGGAAAGVFFGVGAMLLVAVILAAYALLLARGRAVAAEGLTFTGLGRRNTVRRRGRSVATVALVACGVFMVIAVGANRKEAGPAETQRAGGTGGFALFARSTLPVLHNPLSPRGLREYALPEDFAARVRAVVPLRVHEGDDASCLNLNRVLRPRIAGVDPAALAQRGSFTFIETLTPPPDGGNPWRLLEQDLGPDVVPAVGDAATLQWSVGKAVGEEIAYADERGRTVRLRLVGALAGSVLQGQLVIAEAAFVRLFPSDSGYRMLLVDVAPEADAGAVARVLSEHLADAGLAVTPATERLAEFNAVQNTYLVIFQTLGGLGLALGSAGLGVVVLRNVLERRRELALMRAVGFTKRRVAWLLLVEHADLLAEGLVCGLVASVAAVWPVVAASGAPVPWMQVGALTLAVAISGLLWTALATAAALRGSLLAALREE